jgi:hypothetical protein
VICAFVCSMSHALLIWFEEAEAASWS